MCGSQHHAFSAAGAADTSAVFAHFALQNQTLTLTAANLDNILAMQVTAVAHALRERFVKTVEDRRTPWVFS